MTPAGRKPPRTREAAIREWHRDRKRGKFSPKRLKLVRAAIEQSDRTEPMKAAYWANLSGFSKADQVKPELRQLHREGLVENVDGRCEKTYGVAP